MVEGDRRGLSYNECRRDLRLREQAWHELEWRKRIDVKLPDFASMNSLVKLIGGILYVFEDISHDSTFQRVARVVLPTSQDDEKNWQPIWEELEFNCRVQYVCADVAHDLLVLAEITYL